jgi:hypothetical protein
LPATTVVPAESVTRFSGRTLSMNVWDFVLAGLIGLIDLNPFLDLIFTPVAWAITFLTGN